MIRQMLLDYAKNREKFSLPRLLVRFDFFSNIYYFIFYFNLLPDNDVKAEVSFYALQTIFIVGVTLFNYIRFNRKYYFPLFREMPENTFWSYVLLILFLLRIPFIRSFISSIESPWFAILHLCFSVVILFQILVTFQSRFWAKSDFSDRQKRIKKLLKKAGLSKNEYKTLNPVLVNSANLKEKTPFLWKVILFLFSLVIAVILSDSASNFLDLLIKEFSLTFLGVLPPY